MWRALMRQNRTAVALALDRKLFWPRACGGPENSAQGRMGGDILHPADGVGQGIGARFFGGIVRV